MARDGCRDSTVAPLAALPSPAMRAPWGPPHPVPLAPTPSAASATKLIVSAHLTPARRHAPPGAAAPARSRGGRGWGARARREDEPARPGPGAPPAAAAGPATGSASDRVLQVTGSSGLPTPLPPPRRESGCLLPALPTTAPRGSLNESRLWTRCKQPAALIPHDYPEETTACLLLWAGSTWFCSH